MAAWPISIAGHLLVLMVLFSWHKPIPPEPGEAAPMLASLVRGERPPAAEPAAAKPAHHKARRTRPAPPVIQSRAAGDSSRSEPVRELSEAELAGAATADTGSGDGGDTGASCNMPRRLQDALRRDALVQAAVAEARRAPGASGGAMMVWNGDWVRTSGQDGKGLAAVREAITWEVAFAPAACVAEPVHGLVLVSLDDAPGAARLVVGADAWRWSDLLGLRPGR